ncbi:uncharacterized protein J4E88_006435 [Alternaria novae-zelandiae]|uniref:uncharacterized protein n=1 Tax=Alternaria novae-zelandiae TaxID=430562 RepID=UPI0020C24248|nr:uncharacterized protein J4E88_006435 [Alternaria novae-zelandiae]KAI4679142.1 hypothetical protein J4E88_006435 [Alternaria novae-zelandiae]
MAPPRTTKKSTLTSPSTATTRQSARHSRKQVINEADDFEDLDQVNSAIDDELDEAEALQRISDGPLELMMVKMVDDRRKYHDTSKKNVGIAYNKKKEELEESINAVFDTHEAEASAAHQAQLKRLQDLLGQKINIEAAMGRQLASLQKIHNAHSRDLETVVERRLREMK